MISKYMHSCAIGLFLVFSLAGCSSEEETSAPQAKESSSSTQPAPEAHILSNEQEILKQARTIDSLLQADAKKKQDAIDNANSEN